MSQEITTPTPLITLQKQNKNNDPIQEQQEEVVPMITYKHHDPGQQIVPFLQENQGSSSTPFNDVLIRRHLRFHLKFQFILLFLTQW